MTTSKLTEIALTPPNVPPPDVKVLPHEEEAIAAMIEHFGAPDFVVPEKEGSAKKTPLNDREKMFLSRETFHRFYVGQTRNNGPGTELGLKQTIARLERTLVWRRTHGLDDVEGLAKIVDECWRTSMIITQGFSTTGMPIVYFFPNRDYLDPSRRNVFTAFFLLERAIDLMTNGQNQVLVIFSFVGKREGHMPGVQITKDLIFGFADHYPESLGRAIVMDIPWWMRAFINIIWPFVDPYTKQKVRFIGGAQAIADGEISADYLLKECGGNLNLPYNHETYSSTLLRMSLERREAHYKAWLDLGPPAVGRSERDFKSSNV